MSKLTKNLPSMWLLVASLACSFCLTHALPRADSLDNNEASEDSNAELFVDWSHEARSANDNDSPGLSELRKSFARTPKVCNDCACGVGRKTRIVGGNFTTIYEYPWMVGMLKQGQFHCGGSLITRSHVLTAAHCVSGYEQRHFLLHMGDHDIMKHKVSSFNRRVKSWNIHPGFNPYTLNNDIAVIELDRPINLNGIVRTACLPDNSAIDYSGSMGTAIGWGRIRENADVSQILRDVKVPVLSDEECDDSGYPKSRRTENMFCAGYLEGHKDACSGDSGGPLLVEGPSGYLEVIGITSYGRGCARPRYPGVYTKLTNYLGWLQDSLKTECVCPPPNRLA